MWKSRKNNSRISISLFISLVMHTFVITFLIRENTFDKKNSQNNWSFIEKKRTIKMMEIKTISKAQIAKIKSANSFQIVQSAQNKITKEAVKSRFSGESNQLFDRQTVARNVDTYRDAGLGSKSGRSEVAKNEQSSKPFKKLNSPKLSLSEIGAINLNTNDNHNIEIEKLQKELEKSHADNLGLESGVAGKTGLAATNDFVEDIPLGDVTNLNTTENKYYGFYHRIRQKLEQYWGSTIHAQARKLYKSGRRMPASDNLITAVIVVLSDKGQILDIKIEGSSGIRELDQAAVESFNKAGPFPNPPKGLLVDGRAIIQWGFVVKS